MPKDTHEKGHPYRDKSPLPAVVAVIFLLAMVYGIFSEGWGSNETPRVDDRKAYGLSSRESLPVTNKIPTLYSSSSASGRATVADTVGERGLWLAGEEHQGKTFAILSNRLSDTDLEVGQSVHVEGQVYRCEGLNQISLSELSAQTVANLEEEDTFLYIEVLQPGPTESVNQGQSE
jgi:hypothetical protein